MSISDDASGSIADVPSPRPVLSRRTVFSGRVWDVVTEDVDLGAEQVTRDFVRHRGAVAVIPYREPGEVFVLRQYRHPVGHFLWEPPAGLLDVDGELPLDTARRELFEEADMVAETWDVLLDVFSSPGGSSEAIRLYLARDLSDVPVDRRFQREAEELNMETRWLPLEEAVEAVLDGRVSSPTSVTGFLAVDAARRSGWTTLRPPTTPWKGPL